MQAARDPAAEVRYYAAAELAWRAAGEERWLDLFETLLADPCIRLRRMVAGALVRHARRVTDALREIGRGLHSADQGPFGFELGLRGFRGASLPLDVAARDLVYHALGDPDPLVRRAALYAIDRLFPLHDELLPGVVNLAKDPAAEVRMQALDTARQLRGRRPPDPALLPALVEAVSLHEEYTSLTVLEAAWDLIEMGPGCRPAAPVLTAGLAPHRYAHPAVQIMFAVALISCEVDVQRARDYLLAHPVSRLRDDIYHTALPAQVADALQHSARLLHLAP